MTDEQFTRLQTARKQLETARRAFAQNPNPSLSRSIAQLARHIRRLQTARYTIECTDTFCGEANYCWVRRFSVRASSIRGAAIVAGRHLGYSGRLRIDGSWGDGSRYNVTGAAVCFFVGWYDDSQPGEDETYPMI